MSRNDWNDGGQKPEPKHLVSDDFATYGTERDEIPTPEPSKTPDIDLPAVPGDAAADVFTPENVVKGRIVREAIRRGWDIDKLKTSVVKALEGATDVAVAALQTEQAMDGVKAIASIGKTVAVMDGQNQTDHWNADRNQRLDNGKLTDRTGIDAVILRQAIMPPTEG